MQLTANYNLKKPEGTDSVDVQDFNDNADIIDAELKKKAETNGGNISEMTIKTLDTITAEFPVPVAGESVKIFLGKVKKFFEDLKNWMSGVCMVGQIVNNCVTERSDLPLSAAQGKALMDLYSVLNTNLDYSSRPDVMSKSEAIQMMWDKLFPFGQYLYYSGDEKADVTGGWIVAGYCRGVTDTYVQCGSIIRYADRMNFSASGTHYVFAQIITSNLIRLADYSKIKIEYTVKSGNAPVLCLLTDRNYNLMSDDYPQIAFDSAKTSLEYDVTQYSGSYYIGIYYQNYTISINTDIFSIQLIYI